MSRTSARRQKQRAATTAAKTSDSFQNFATRTGMGAGSANDSAKYGFNPVSRNRLQMEFCYRSSWIAGQAVDTVAEDMTRERIEIHSDIPPDDLEKLEKEAGRLGVWSKLCDTVKWGRLYGGAIAVMLIDGQKTDTPLRVDTIAKGQFRGLLDLDRWVLQPTLNDLVTEFGPDYGKPKYYDVIPDAGGLAKMSIHHSRVIRIDGVDLPYWQRISENGWGQSVLERLWDRLIAFDSTTEGAAQLVYKAHLRTYKVKGLRDIIAVGGKAFEGLVKQIEMIRQYQSNEGMTLMDAEDEFETHQYAFSGLSDMMLQFAQQVSGALQIPLVRLLGQSPAGLNSTGESDLRTYYDNVRQQQERRLRNGVATIYGVLYRSVFGRPPPDSFEIEFAPLWQMSDEQKANVTNQNTAAVCAAFDSQIIDRPTAMRELRQLSQVTGTFSNVSDDLIEAAENEPPPMPGEGEQNAADPAAQPGADPGQEAVTKPAAAEGAQG